MKMTGRELFKDTFDSVHASEQTVKEILNMAKQNNTKRRAAAPVRRAAAVAAIICAVAAFSAAAYAAGTHFGLIDFTRGRTDEIPVSAAQLITDDIGQTRIGDTESGLVGCRVLEALCDSRSVSIVYEAAAAERGKYLFIPTDAIPEDDMSEWSDISGMTAREYAESKGLEIVNIGGGITNTDELGIASEALDFRMVVDDVMDICVRAFREKGGDNLNVECTATARPLGSSEVSRSAVSCTLRDASTVRAAVYEPVGDAELSDNIRVLRAELCETELYSYIDVYFAAVDDKYAESVTFAALAPDGSVINIAGGCGIEKHGGVYVDSIVYSGADFGNSFVLTANDIYSGNALGTVTLRAAG